MRYKCVVDVTVVGFFTGHLHVVRSLLWGIWRDLRARSSIGLAKINLKTF
jgi:hypothetical protein